MRIRRCRWVWATAVAVGLVLANFQTRSAPADPSAGRIALQPQPGAMQVTVRVPGLGNPAFALGIPETIGCREAMLVNFPEAIHGQDPRITASKELGEKLVAEIVSRLAGQVEEALNGVIRQTKP